MDPSLRAGKGARWMVRFKFRGKFREVLIRIAEMDPPQTPMSSRPRRTA